MKRSPRCPKCGRAPPIRRATMGDSEVRITTKCSGEWGCGTKYEIATDELELDEDVEVERLVS